jgi:hypothetical protein
MNLKDRLFRCYFLFFFGGWGQYGPWSVIQEPREPGAEGPSSKLRLPCRSVPHCKCTHVQAGHSGRPADHVYKLLLSTWSTLIRASCNTAVVASKFLSRVLGLRTRGMRGPPFPTESGIVVDWLRTAGHLESAEDRYDGGNEMEHVSTWRPDPSYC